MKPPRKGPAPSPPASALEPVPTALAVPVMLLAALLVGLAVSFRIDDADIWQHLAVGRAMWRLHEIPQTNLWTWPGFGDPYVLPSWLFRALLWPFWRLGGEWGLAAWRWLVTLATFAFLWRAARHAGARGLAPLVIIVWCSLILRQRSMVRPEMLASLMLAAELWIFERRRAGDRNIVWWLIPLAGVWINAHISYTLFFVVAFAYLVDDFVHRREAYARPGRLALVLGASLAACFANPFGFAAIWQPFDYVLRQRHEPLFQVIDELQGIPWPDNLRNGLPVLLALAVVLGLARWRRRFDAAQAVLYAFFLSQALQSLRFLGPLAVVLTVFLSRDLAEVFASRTWPAWARSATARSALTAAACLLIAVPELLRPNAPLGLGFAPGAYPTAACDWIERHAVRGRAYNPFDAAGYLLWRFWPQRDRLPFVDIHQTASRLDRDRMANLHQDSRAWAELDREHRFDWVLLPRVQGEQTRRVDWLAADSAFAPVFLDDQWALWLRRDGSMAALAESAAYHRLPASFRAMQALGDTVVANPAVRAELRAELERAVRESPRSAHAHSLLANLGLLEGHWAAAISELEAARRINPALPGLDAREQAAEDSLKTDKRR